MDEFLFEQNKEHKPPRCTKCKGMLRQTGKALVPVGEDKSLHSYIIYKCTNCGQKFGRLL